MFHDTTESTQIEFVAQSPSTSGGTVKWGDHTAKMDGVPQDFGVNVDDTVQFTIQFSGANPLPVLSVIYNGTTSAPYFELSPSCDPAWSNDGTDLFVCSLAPSSIDAKITAAYDDGILIVGTIDIGGK